MYTKTFPTDFSVEGFVAQETPVTFGLFNEAEARSDLNDLFKFPTENKDAMPFYVFSGTEANHVANISEEVYAALCSAVDYLNTHRELVPEFFGREFCEQYPEFIEYAFYTWDNDHEACYGRFDMAMNPETGKITGIYEFNGDTPVMLFESTILQNWLTQQVNAKNGTNFDQHNFYYHETVKGLDKLFQNRFGESSSGIVLHAEYIEDMVTCDASHSLL